jgi:hypothetical protein
MFFMVCLCVLSQIAHRLRYRFCVVPIDENWERSLNVLAVKQNVPRVAHGDTH